MVPKPSSFSPSLLTCALCRLVKKDGSDQARNILELLHSGEQDAIDSELEDIKLSLSMSTNRASLKGLFTMGPPKDLSSGHVG